jgi:hypothetical protein
MGLLDGSKDKIAVILILDTEHGIAYCPECPDEIKAETNQEQV